MNGCRKSDIFVVPEKSSNKPDNVGAEKMEGRSLPKENKRQQNMLRTQRRDSVHSKLQLIHQRAKSGDYPNKRIGVIIRGRNRMR